LIPGHCGVEVNETADSDNHLKKPEIANYYYQLQIEKPNGKLNTTRSFTDYVRGESYFEEYYRNGSSPWFREIKMNRRVFMSINRVRTGHTSLKASLSRCIICSWLNANVMTSCKQRKLIFWDCKLYEEQKATMTDILSENSKKYTQTQIRSS
jgi:hypothetical protein